MRGDYYLGVGHVAELVYAYGSEPYSERIGGSSPLMPTMIRAKEWIYELMVFGLKEARACIFAGSFFILLFASNHIPLFGLARYDFLFISAILIQVALYL